jgi:hypothetical protein
MPRQLPCEELCRELTELGIPPELQTREALWRIVAERWKTSAPIPYSMTVDQLATMAIELLRSGESRP